MDMRILGNDNQLKPVDYGAISRLDDGTLRTSGNQKRLRQIEAMTLNFHRPDGSIRRVEPGDPDWFYALPLGLSTPYTWAVPTDWPAWEAIAAEKFGYTRKHES